MQTQVCNPLTNVWEQSVKGKFTIEVEKGTNHCGPNEKSPKTFPYEVKVWYPANSLDTQGFLMDNLNFNRYFKGLKKTSLSCELLVKQCAHDLRKLCNDKAEAIEVSLYPWEPSLSERFFDWIGFTKHTSQPKVTHRWVKGDNE